MTDAEDLCRSIASRDKQNGLSKVKLDQDFDAVRILPEPLSPEETKIRIEKGLKVDD